MLVPSSLCECLQITSLWASVFLICKMDIISLPSFAGGLGGFNELLQADFPKQCLAHSKVSVSVNC